MAFNPETAVPVSSGGKPTLAQPKTERPIPQPSQENVVNAIRQQQGSGGTQVAKPQVVQPQAQPQVEQVEPQAVTPGGFNPQTAKPVKDITPEKTARSEFATITVPGIGKDGTNKVFNVPNVVIDQIVSPLMEFRRGFEEGGASLFSSLEAVSDLTSIITGADRAFPDQKNAASEFFKKSSETLSADAEKIPFTSNDIIGKTFFQMAGAAIPITTEFALVKLPGAVAHGIGGLGSIAKFSIVEGLNAFNEERKAGGNLIEIGAETAKGAAKGATIAMSFGAAAQSLKILHSAGKNSLAWVLGVTSGDKVAAQRLANDPSSLNVNPLSGKAKKPHEIQKENKARRDNFIAEQAEKKADSLEKATATRLQRQNDNRDALGELKAYNNEVKQKVNEGANINISNTAAKAKEIIKKKQQAVLNSAVTFYDNALTRFQDMKSAAGEAVGVAVRNILNVNPAAGVPARNINAEFGKIIDKNQAFKIEKRGRSGRQVSKVSQLEDNKQAEQLQILIDDYRDASRSGKISFEWLQRTKNRLRALADQHLKPGDSPGKNKQLGILYSDLSTLLNPANIVTRDANLTAQFGELAKANTEFGLAQTRYESAMKFYFKKDGNSFIPDPQRAITAISSGNSVVTREMRRADLALEKADQLFPKMKELVNQADEVIAQQAGISKSLKIAVTRQKAKLAAAQRETTANQVSKGNKLTADQNIKLREEKNKFVAAQKEELKNMEKDIDKQIETAKAQESLRTFTATNRTPAGIGQKLAFFASLGAAGGTELGVAPAGAFMTPLAIALGLSPGTTAPLIKGAIQASGSNAQMFKLLSTSSAKKSLSTSAIRQAQPGESLLQASDRILADSSRGFGFNPAQAVVGGEQGQEALKGLIKQADERFK